jgi:hypothetical protein
MDHVAEHTNLHNICYDEEYDTIGRYTVNVEDEIQVYGTIRGLLDDPDIYYIRIYNDQRCFGKSL